MNVSVFKDALLKKRAELVEGAGLNSLQSSMEHNNGRQGDMADQASGNNEVHIQLRLKQTDAKILFHTDGNVTPLLDDLIEIGVDILNPVQPSALGDLAALKASMGSGKS